MTASTLERGESVPPVEDTASPPVHQPEVGDPPRIISRGEHQEFPPFPSLRHHPLQAVIWTMKAITGVVFLVALLATTASLPVLNLFALGYLVETQGQVARTGKLRSAFYLLPAAQRLGGMWLAIWLWLLPIQFLAGATRDSWLLVPDTLTAWLWTVLLLVTSVLIAVHLLMAIACGGGWWRFARPISNARWVFARVGTAAYWRDAHLAIGEFVAAFRLPQLLGLGFASYAAVYLWLFVPTLLFTALHDVISPWQRFAFMVGCITLVVMLLWMPLLLAHVAAAGRWRSMFEFATVRALAGQTPFCWAMATAILFACSIVPLLYTALIKIQIPPHDARWDLMLVFLVTVAPARALVGWVYHRAATRTPAAPTWFWRIWQLANGAGLCAGVGYYVYFLYLAETGGELGQRAVWQFHALLLPWPF